MRTVSFLLLAAVIVVGAALYAMVPSEGEGERVAAVPEPVRTQPAGDWRIGLDRHEAPSMATSVAFRDGEGKPVSLADFRGRGVVLNLWATWCAPCVREMPSLNRLQAAVEEEGVAVVAVSSDREGMAAVAPFLAQHGLDRLRPYLDEKGEFTRSLPGRGLPRTYIINAAGEVAATYVGPAEWDEPELVAIVRELAR